MAEYGANLFRDLTNEKYDLPFEEKKKGFSIVSNLFSRLTEEEKSIFLNKIQEGELSSDMSQEITSDFVKYFNQKDSVVLHYIEELSKQLETHIKFTLIVEARKMLYPWEKE